MYYREEVSSSNTAAIDSKSNNDHWLPSCPARPSLRQLSKITRTPRLAHLSSTAHVRCLFAEILDKTHPNWDGCPLALAEQRRRCPVVKCDDISLLSPYHHRPTVPNVPLNGSVRVSFHTSPRQTSSNVAATNRSSSSKILSSKTRLGACSVPDRFNSTNRNQNRRNPSPMRYSGRFDFFSCAVTGTS